MKAGYVLAAVVVALVSVWQPVFGQGRSGIQPFEQRRADIITPGSLYKNRTFNQNTPGNFNNANQPGNRSSSTLPQSTATQPLSKPMTLGTVQQPSTGGALPNTTTSQVPSFTSSYKPMQSTPQATQQQPIYTMGQQFTASQRSTFSSSSFDTRFSAPMQQPSYLMSPQYMAASPSPFGGQPNAMFTPPAKPIYTLDPSANTSSMFSSGNTSMTGLQRTPPLQLSPMSLSPPTSSAPLATPLNTPLTTSPKQPLYVPESPYIQPPPARR
ncbi:MAG: hypothetical protein HZA88_24055 [Verrucomicrobia bacterium]|nr:hypothetical protein [Verrucomicrobiota bacterium]